MATMMNLRQFSFNSPKVSLPFFKRFPQPVKLICIALVLILPLILVWMILTPLVQKMESKTEQYTLKDNFSKADLNQLVQQMKFDPEYRFYFNILGEQALSGSIAQAYDYLELARDRIGMRQVIDRLRNRIESAAVQVLSLPLPPDFLNTPSRYEEVCRSLYEFVRTEFVLTLAGVCYKLRHDEAFTFSWSTEASQAAYRVQEIFLTLTDQQRQDIERLILWHKPVSPP